jgi:parvulin-like peptidyl-prolyl isomerase
MVAGFLLLILAPALAGQNAGKSAAGLPQAPLPQALSSAWLPVAVVGEEVITQSDLEKRLAFATFQRGIPPTLVERFRAQVAGEILAEMINQQLLVQAARRKQRLDGGKKEKTPLEGKFHISEAQVDAEIERRIAELRKLAYGINGEEDLYRREGEPFGFSRKEFRKLIRDRLTSEAYWRYEVLPKLDSWVTPREKRIYYLNHIDEFTTPVEVSFRQIFLNDDRFSPEDIKAIEEGLRNGAPFEELARRYSHESENPADCGRLWTKSFKELESWKSPVIPETLKRLKKGEVSGRLDAERGFYYLLLVDRVDGKPKSFEEVQDEIEERIRLRNIREAYDRLMRDLRAHTRIEIYLAQASPEARGTAGGAGPAAASGSGAVTNLASERETKEETRSGP